MTTDSKQEDTNIPTRKRHNETPDERRLRIKLYQAEYRRNNIERLKAWSREYNKENSERNVARAEKWQKANRERHNKAVADYAKRKPEVASAASKRFRQRKITDLDFMINERLKKSQYRAKQRGLEFNLTIEYLKSIFPTDGRCPMLDHEFDLTRQNLEHVASIDRIDNNKGYIQGNVWFISYRANSLKRYRNIDDLRQYVAKLEAELATGKQRKNDHKFTIEEMKLILEGLERKLNEMNPSTS